jgi:hypothetical protein
MDGWTAAFSLDGTRLAYQSGDSIHVARLDGTELSSFEVAAGTSLAGKGAWSRDGRDLMLVSGRRCGCGEGYGVRWTLYGVDAVTAAPTGTSYTFDGLYAIRMLGWWASANPAIAGYVPEAGTRVTTFTCPTISTGSGTSTMSTQSGLRPCSPTVRSALCSTPDRTPHGPSTYPTTSWRTVSRDQATRRS